MKPFVCFALALAFAQGGSAQEPPTFSTESELVVLHVAVRDRKGGYIGGLEQTSFRVLENKLPQTITFFHNQDAPVTIGLLIDSSRSMGPNRELVIAAAMEFAKAMNPQDEFFVLGFNEDLHVPLPSGEPFTHHEPTLRVALVQAIKAEGQTAIYNAVDAGLEHVNKGAFERQVLVVLSDGGDNASRITREDVLATAQGSNAVIYSIALVDPLDRDADPKFLSDLSRMTGGLAFRPQNAREVAHIFQRIAIDIRNMYTLGYVPSASRESMKPLGRSGRLREVAVEVRSADGQKLAVRTRRAYLAGVDEVQSDAR
jgi:Ca-activated chloride channel family protein